MGEMGLLHLTYLLFLQSRILVLPFILIHLPRHIFHFLPALLCLPHLLQLAILLHLLPLLAPSSSDVPEISGCQSNGQCQIATNSQGCPHQQLSLQMKMTLPLMIPLTSSRLVRHPLLSPHPTCSLSDALMQICGTQHVRKRWRPTG